MIRFHRPSPPLARFVESFVYFEGLQAVHSLDRFLPDGNTELIFSLKDDPQYIHNNQSFQIEQTCRRAWVSGVRTRPITIPSGRDNRMLVVAFRKGAAHPFYSFPMTEIFDTVIEADLVFGRRILDLRERLLSSASVDAMFALVEKFLLTQAGERIHFEHPFRCVDFAIEKLLLQPHETQLQSLTEQIGFSQKHFIELFKRNVGVTPKHYSRILRFQSVIYQIEGFASSPEWSGFALQNGFYDQAHFINDFRSFSGYTPSEYLKSKSSTLNYVPVL
jgi:AraC-like DNA-binding protein